MESEPNPDEIKAVVLIEIENVYMHRLIHRQKTLFTSGTLKVARLENSKASQPVHFINLNSFYYGIQPNIHFIKVVYPDTIAYLFPHFDNGLSAISVSPLPELIQALDNVLGQSARLVSPPQAMKIAELGALVEAHYPSIQTEQIYYPDSVKKAIATTGTFLNKAFTTIGGYLKAGVQKCGNYIDSKISQGEPTQLSQSTKENWGKFKNNTNHIIHISSEYASKILEPVVERTKQYSGQLEEKITHSANPTLQYFRELAKVSGKAIGDAFEGLLEGGTQVTRQLGNQGKKIISKKYGEEVVKTLTGQASPAERESENQVGLKENPTQKVEEPSPK